MGTGYGHDLCGRQWMPMKKDKNRTRRIPKDPLRPQEYAKAAPEPEGLLLYVTAVSKGFSLEFSQSVLQTYSIQSVPREEFHRLTMRKSPYRQRIVPEALSSYAALSQQVAH